MEEEEEEEEEEKKEEEVDMDSASENADVQC